MKHILRVLSATAALVLLSSTAQAVVVVQAFTQEIMDIGTKSGYGEVADDQITAFQDGIGAHEVTGHLVFSAHEGQVGGFAGTGTTLITKADICSGVKPFRQANFDTGDFDIPDRLFGCQDLTVPNTGLGCFGGGADVSISNPDSNWFFDSAQECDIAPDSTGRLDSATCTDLYAGVNYAVTQTPTFACAIPPTRATDYTFFNYMACYPDFECFQADPALYTGTCDMGVAGPFDGQLSTGAGNAPGVPNDIWIAGTLMRIRLPMGTRVGNTVYPGTMLNGEGQFGYADSSTSVRMNPLNTLQANYVTPSMWETAGWPAVVYEFEANHLVAAPTPACTPAEPSTFNITWSPSLCMASDEQYDKITLFVPDILAATMTSQGGRAAVFQIGEANIDQAGMMPADRLTVNNCYRDNIGCVDGAGIPMGGDPCDYDTRLCLDIRGAYSSLRSVYSDPLRRYVVVNPETPQDSPVDFSPPSNWQIGILKSRTTNQTPTSSFAPESFPSCDGYNFCYVIDTNANGTYEAGIDEDYPDPALANPPHFLHIPYSSVGSVTITEPNPGFIRVESTTIMALRSTLTCELATDDSNGNDASDGVDFVFADLMGTMNTTINGSCPFVYMPTALPVGQVDLTVTPATSGMTWAFPIDGGVAPNDPGPAAGELGGSDQIIVQINSESSGSAASLTLHGLELLIQDDADSLPGGMGCIEVDCTLHFPGEECQLHEGVANLDNAPNLHGKTATQHLPVGGGNYGPPDYFDNMPIACIVPGRTTLLYPYMVKALGYDTGIVVTNTSGTHAIAHFYLYQEEGPINAAKPATANVGLNPTYDILQDKDPERLSKTNSPCMTTPAPGAPCPQTYYDAYNELPPYGQYVNMVFAIENDPLTPKNDWSAALGLEPSTGIFGANVLASLTSDPDGNAATDDGRVWMYVVVQQCYSHGYQMVFSDGGFGSTLALVDNETNLVPVNDDLTVNARSTTTGATSAKYFVPFHTAPSRYIAIDPTKPDVETRKYRYWDGNDE